MHLYFDNPYIDPTFNLALEEFLFLNYDEPLFHLWQNSASVILGKNQLYDAELDAFYLKNNEIEAVRRFSGGGAVYQDLGNINLSFMNSDHNFRFDQYNEEIMQFLINKGLQPTTNERRAIFIDELKISGSSQHIRSKKSVYHATLLFDANLTHLEYALKGNENAVVTQKHVKSVRSPVTNLKHYFPKEYTLLDFRRDILQFFTNSNSKKITLSDNDLKQIEGLKKSKYKQEIWTSKGRYNFI